MPENAVKGSLVCGACGNLQTPDERGPSACCTSPRLIVACDHDFSGPRRYKGSDMTDCTKGCGAYLDMDNDYVHEKEVRSSATVK